jgi:hypothetical protein
MFLKQMYKHDPTKIEELRVSFTLPGYFAQRVDDANPDDVYIGIAPVGALVTESVWIIKRVYKDINGETVTKFACDTVTQSIFNQIWDGHAGLLYI